MAIIRGGIHGRPSGNVSNVVYGAARTRIGKAVTARELVYPSNPQTASQMLQRHIFMESLSSTRRLGSALWQDSFNRSIGQLPGFQSMMSILLNNTDASEEFTPPPSTPLGDLYFPGTFTCTTGAGASGSFTLDWSTETGSNGTVADPLRVFTVWKVAGASYTRPAAFQTETANRSVAQLVVQTGDDATEQVVGCFFDGAGAALGNISQCKWFAVTTVA